MTLIRTKRQNGNAIPSHRSDLLDLFETHPFFPETLLSQPILNWNGNSPRIPATNVRETQDEYRVELAAPGMRKEDFTVDIQNNELAITCEKEIEKEEIEDEYTRRVYDYRNFHRAFSLPKTVKTESVKAEYKDGILRVRLPKIALRESEVKAVTIE